MKVGPMYYEGDEGAGLPAGVYDVHIREDGISILFANTGWYWVWTHKLGPIIGTGMRVTLQTHGQPTEG